VIDAYVGRIPWTKAPAGFPLAAVWSRAVDEAVSGLRWVRQAWCGVGGHEMVKRFEPGRVSLECLSCGGQTRGWTLDR
jgi:hypothetical protein